MSNKLTEQIASRLRDARIDSGFKSAKDFANSHDIPASTYSQHETGKRSINAELILNYSKLLQINPYWLLTGKGSTKLESTIGECESYYDLERTIDLDNYEEKLIQNTELLKIILISADPLFYDKSIKFSYVELIDYCFDIYNIVCPLSISMEEKKKIVDLSISSVKLGSSIDYNNK